MITTSGFSLQVTNNNELLLVQTLTDRYNGVFELTHDATSSCRVQFGTAIDCSRFINELALLMSKDSLVK